jgi:hypothetical protein
MVESFRTDTDIITGRTERQYRGSLHTHFVIFAASYFVESACQVRSRVSFALPANSGLH